MDLEEIKQVLRRLNQKSWKLPEILYWMCDSRALTDEQIGERVGYSYQTIYTRKLTLNEIFLSHNIDSTDATVCQAIRELAGNPPRFHPWPPLEEVSVVQDNESESEANLSTIEGEENQIFPPEDFEEEEFEEETEEPPAPHPPVIVVPSGENRQRRRSPTRWPFFLVAGLLLVAFVFGFILIAQSWRPFNRGTATPQSQEVAENETSSSVSQPTPDLEATREQIREDIVASRTPTAASSPIPNETQLFIEESNLFATQDAQTLEAILATETAQVTNISTSTTTAPNTPTSTPTPLQFLVGETHTDGRVSLTLNARNKDTEWVSGVVSYNYAMSFHFTFVNNSGDTLFLGSTNEDFILVDEKGVEYLCFFRVHQNALNRELANGQSTDFEIGCGRNMPIPSDVVNLYLIFEGFSSLPKMQWLIELPR